MPLVFIGAFFLLNLTLAVINSEFTKAHKEHQAQEASMQHSTKTILIDNELEGSMDQKDELSIAQFITARIYAKKMIEFLRRRQAAKRVEALREQKQKAKVLAFAQAKRRVPLVTDGSEGASPAASAKKGDALTPDKKVKLRDGTLKNGVVDDGVIQEDEAEQTEHQSDQE